MEILGAADLGIKGLVKLGEGHIGEDRVLDGFESAKYSVRLAEIQGISRTCLEDHGTLDYAPNGWQSPSAFLKDS